MPPLKVIIVQKDAVLTPYQIKEYTEEKLFKKCGFKSPNGFHCFATWSVRLANIKHVVKLYGKDTGKALSENKYDFPPPADRTLLFGNALLVGFVEDANNPNKMVVSSLTMDDWKKIEEKLFGGFEDLAKTAMEDEMEPDELADLSPSLKTKHGYLKDGFVVSSSDEEVHDVVKSVKAAAAAEKKKKKKTTTTTASKLKKKSGKNKNEPELEKKEFLLNEEEYDY
jgi:hypothetical protein